MHLHLSLIARRTLSLAFLCSYTKTINAAPPRGKLCIVPTPIGNMDDISPNMLRALLSADLIGCEDRRVAGQLYSLIRNRNILGELNNRFGDIGLTALAPTGQNDHPEPEKEHQLYNYANMSDKERRKFLRQFSEQEQEAFKVEYLKYRALKVLGKFGDAPTARGNDKFDELYGIELTDLKHIESQIYNCRKNKGRGVLIPLNTYSETKMFDLVRALLETKTVALVSDAGMPCISDPGWKLVDKIRTTMPQLPIEVVGGPSSVGIMALQAALGTVNDGLSGRFEGFSNLTTGNFEENNVELRNVKMEEFSINFINAKKLKKRLLYLEQAFSGDHRILLANELTKKYERRYYGTIAGLIEKMGNQPDFEPIGEVSYLVFPDKTTKTHKLNQPTSSTCSPKSENNETVMDVSSMTSASVSIKKMLTSLEKYAPEMSPKDKCSLLCAVFGIKQGEARKHVYEKFAKE